MTTEEIKRDRWGRPLIVPPGGGEAVAYTRVSTLAKSLDDRTALEKWLQRVIAVGLVRSPHLLDRIVAIASKHADPVREASRELNGILRDAELAGGSGRAADTGTALHQLTEVLDGGGELLDSGRWLDHLDAYVEATAHLEILAMEQFVVNDVIQAAGTFDRLVRLPDGRVVVADLKTGKSDPDYPLGVTTQIATYARGFAYSEEFGRTSLHADLDPSVGLLIHLPHAESPRCDLYLLDLERGWQAALTAASVRDLRKFKKADLVTAYDAKAAA